MNKIIIGIIIGVWLAYCIQYFKVVHFSTQFAGTAQPCDGEWVTDIDWQKEQWAFFFDGWNCEPQ